LKIHSALQRNDSLPRVFGVALLVVLMNLATMPHAYAAASMPKDNLQQLLDKAHAATMETRAPYLLDATDLALQQNQLPVAERTLQEIGELKLRDDQRARSNVLHAQLLLQQGKPDLALNLLQSRELQQDSAQLSTREQTNISLIRAQAFAATGKYYASAQERIFVNPLLKDNDSERNHQEIQRALMQLSAAELQQNLSNTTNEAARGWLELALAAKTNQTAASSDWSRKWPAHSASSQVITGTTSTDNSVFRSQQIALLLPQSGKLAAFGDAIRDGFFAALYAANRNTEPSSIVRIYNTEGAGIVALYQQAVSDGATLVIGPLEKNLVAQFYTQVLPVPLLTLNRADIKQAPPGNLYQLALAPEDETAAIATLAAKDNLTNVLIVASDDETRSNELEVFTRNWHSLGGNIVATAPYRDQQNMSAAIRSALNIPRSEARSKEMESLLNRNIEFTPHRRRDMDMVFMLAKPVDARLIKPLLDFYYAGDLPIYSTSRIYAGYSNGNADRDIEKVRFTEIPWVLQQSAMKQQILNARPAGKNYLRLYALGIDSFTIYPRLRQMEAAPDLHINGQTGMLSLDAQRIVQRTLPLAEMRVGIPHVIDSNGTLAQSSDINNDTGKDGNVEQKNNPSP
jgi:uncharacterized protein